MSQEGQRKDILFLLFHALTLVKTFLLRLSIDSIRNDKYQHLYSMTPRMSLEVVNDASDTQLIMKIEEGFVLLSLSRYLLLRIFTTSRYNKYSLREAIFYSNAS